MMGVNEPARRERCCNAPRAMRWPLAVHHGCCPLLVSTLACGPPLAGTLHSLEAAYAEQPSLDILLDTQNRWQVEDFLGPAPKAQLESQYGTTLPAGFHFNSVIWLRFRVQSD